MRASASLFEFAAASASIKSTDFFNAIGAKLSDQAVRHDVS